MQALMIFLAMIAAMLFTGIAMIPGDGVMAMTFLMFMVMFTFGVTVGSYGRGRA
jgi:hypothetical protein